MGHYEGKSKSYGPYTLLNILLWAKEAQREKGSLKEHLLEWKPQRFHEFLHKLPQRMDAS